MFWREREHPSQKAEIIPQGEIFRDFRAYSVKFSPDERYIACSGLGGTRVWDNIVRKEAVHIDQEGSLAFSPNGKTLLIGADRTIHMLSMDHPEAASVTSREMPWGNNYFTPKIVDLSFSPNGDSVVVARSDAMAIPMFWPPLIEQYKIPIFTAEEERQFELHFLKNVLGTLNMGDIRVSFVPKTDLLAICTEYQIYFVDIRMRRDGIRIARPEGTSTANFLSVAFSSDGRYMAAGFDYAPVVLWDAADFVKWSTPQPKWQAGGSNGGYVQALAFSPDGRAVVWGGRGGVLSVLNAVNGKEMVKYTIPGSFGCSELFGLDISSENTIVTCDRTDTVRLWSLKLK